MSSVYHPSSSPSLQKFPPATFTRPSVSVSVSVPNSPNHFSGPNAVKGKDIWVKLRFGVQCTAVSRSRTTEYEYAESLKSDLPAVINWQEILESDKKGENTKLHSSIKIIKCINSIREMFRSMDDGAISLSAYDTAWVALVEDMNEPGVPQFPASLQWIVSNQLPDGSWGDDKLFLAHDRILNTLACVIALKSWNVHPEKMERGLLFINENISKLEDEEMEHMPIGFEVAFPSLVEIAETLNIQIPKDLPILQEIYAQRDLKLSRIPKDIMHKVPTTLLHSLEGMAEMEWEKLLKLQCEDGSFLFSPSSTAFALMQTKDENCLNYLSRIVRKFDGGVPNVYPVDMFEHIWVVDRLERLGISRYFKSEIKECMDYIHRYWTNQGICWARNTRVNDIDDTAMAFRLLRLHGYTVSPDVFKNFESKGEFVCFAGQSNQAVTGMFNLLRASQVVFPEEALLEEAKKFSIEFLRGKQAENQLFDKWIITKDLPGEVGYALDTPWYASLPRLETSFFLDQYGGEDDVWIGKTLYRMPHVNNNTYLELAKLDYAKCQTIYQLEWNQMKEWCANSNLEKFGLSETSLLLSYYLAASSLYEPESSNLRFAWAKTEALIETIRLYFGNIESSAEQREAFVQDYMKTTENLQYVSPGRYKSPRKKLLGTLVGILKQLMLDAMVAHGIDIHQQLHQAWGMWLTTWQEEGDVDKAKAQLLEQTINICAGRLTSEEILSNPQYKNLSKITNQLCHQLGPFQYGKLNEEDSSDKEIRGITAMEIESKMQELVKLVLCNSPDGLDPELKQIFFTLARTFYYTAYCDPITINSHISKVLFGRRM
ncbi:ent-copalyl diphosphate synthase 5 isoform X2 [Daucus carota subsp. sativus]|uniref:ent-copalyl diphosphate synthase 5 isoform X2 n=1 Tax=Daucus carota subsp. sativus TaxID=79200 RepID=UPI0007F03954|nr:PREDICTED: ent-copalyl diphosphate synthase, chloroplastic isoform X2 [Daucus carota subsp. sativus]